MWYVIAIVLSLFIGYFFGRSRNLYKEGFVAGRFEQWDGFFGSTDYFLVIQYNETIDGGRTTNSVKILVDSNVYNKVKVGDSFYVRKK